MVSGNRVFSVDAAIRERGVPVQLQRRASRPAAEAGSERLYRPHAGVFRLLIEGCTEAGMDGERDSVYREGAGEGKAQLGLRREEIEPESYGLDADSIRLPSAPL